MEDFLDDLRHELLTVYHARVGRRYNVHAVEASMLDPVDPGLAGGARIGEMLGCVRYPWTQDMREFLCEEGCVEKTSDEDAEEIHVRVTLTDDALRTIVSWGVARVMGRHERVAARCGMFTVQKQGTAKERLIWDARIANQQMKGGERFALFSLDELIDAYLLGGSIVVLDYRHWFYQLPLPRRWQPYFVVQGTEVRIAPVVVPMGWHRAPRLGQMTTVMTVLYREEGESDLGAVVSEKEMPSMIPIWRGGKQVGNIAFLIDGVAVIIRDRGLRGKWLGRIRRNCKKLHVIIKDEVVERFAGIQFSGGKEWRPLTELGSFPSPVTRREVASIVGRLLWQMRVHQRRMLGEEQLLNIAALIGKGQWEEAHGLREEDIAYLQETWEGLKILGWCSTRAESLEKRGVEEWPTMYIATDATPTTIAWTLFKDGKVREVVSEKGPKESQDIMEMRAVRRAVEHYDGPYRLVIACDNEGVRAVVKKGYSKCPALREELRRMFACRAAVSTVRVAGVYNAADGASRGKGLDGKRVSITWEALMENSWKSK